jgi:hypothetical protein
MLIAQEVAASAAGGLDVANLEFWVVLTNVAIVIATLMLTRVTAKDAMLHEEKVLDKAQETTHDLTEIVHEVLVQEGHIASHEHRTDRHEDEAATPIRAVK